MGFWDPDTHSDVVRAMGEYDRAGQGRILSEHGFGRAWTYVLLHDSKSYDSKAVLGVAYKFATGRPLGAHDFNGGLQGAAAVLRSLGFEVRNLRDLRSDR
ncbi:hypothetical protein E0H75_07155 [Kribbella capetownensis]|uniref:ScoMcrA-like N-terminal head domain-containing protein n=1 Tax=Kribbella capetownensis TaxID=1572659 RepID=A0A4R0K0N0_9ACTN|nr:hypothetical protein [Kribbella capetownensis]TCC53461.1 hypothetical protein E0H75_07155 [Kribbella capetownensis]